MWLNRFVSIEVRNQSCAIEPYSLRSKIKVFFTQVHSSVRVKLPINVKLIWILDLMKTVPHCRIHKRQFTFRKYVYFDFSRWARKLNNNTIENQLNEYIMNSEKFEFYSWIPLRWVNLKTAILLLVFRLCILYTVYHACHWVMLILAFSRSILANKTMLSVGSAHKSTCHTLIWYLRNSMEFCHLP